MKLFFSFFLLLLFFSITVCIYSQENSPFNNGFQPESIWDVQLNINVTGSAAVKDGTFFYVTDNTSNLIRAYTAAGNLIYTFAIPGVTGLEDLAFDGMFEYGGTGGQTIYQMNFQTQTLVGTINSPVTVRHVAYDTDNDAFWIGGNSGAIFQISRNGTVLDTIDRQLSPVSGSAFDGVSPGGPYLWLFVGSTPDSVLIFQYSIPSDSLTGVIHDVLSDVGIGQTNAESGGLFFMDQFVTNTASLGGILVGSPTKLFVYEIYNAVPVELVSFSAQAAEKGVKLNWGTATETNNEGFEIQRSEVRDQRSEVGDRRSEISDFEKIGYVKGSGTTTESKSYTFTDNNISSGTYNYRLKQIDFDGSYKYSEVISVDVNISLEYTLSQNYPNPFNPATEIKYSLPESGFVTLKVYDMLGREASVLVNEDKTAGNYSVTFDGSSLSSGVYFYQLKAGQYTDTKKFVLLK